MDYSNGVFCYWNCWINDRSLTMNSEDQIIDIMKELKICKYVICTQYCNRTNELFDELLFLFNDDDPMTPITLWNHVNSFHGSTRKLLKKLEILTMGQES